MTAAALAMGLALPVAGGMSGCKGGASDDASGDDDGLGVGSGLSETQADASASSEASSGPLLDLGGTGETMSTATETGGGVGCEKVDLVFVIDNSGSMADEQANLLTSFPGFISQIQTQLADVDSYHVGIISSDAYVFNTPGCTAEGAMVTQTGGVSSSLATCGPFAAGFNYMTEADDLSAAFTCAAQLGTGGDGDERPVQTLQASLSESMNAPGACNAGFLRDDAILVVVFITDEEDDHETDGCLQDPQPGSAGDPAGWYAGLTARKAGVETNIVMLTLAGPPGPDPALCPALDKCSGGITGAEVATRLNTLTSMFTHGFVGRVCDADYEPFFAQAVGVIQSACDGFVPPQ